MTNDEFDPFDPTNYAMHQVEVPFCLPCDDDEHRGCYGVLCACPCAGEHVE